MIHPQAKAAGLSRSPEYRAWQHMKSRCSNPRHHQYPRYGGRGIRVCARWLASFADFLDDMGPRPSPRHSLERRDNDGPYCPENCTWATAVQQMRNRRNTRFVTVTMPLAAWAEQAGLRYHTFLRRLDRGMAPATALTRPLARRGRRVSGSGGSW